MLAGAALVAGLAHELRNVLASADTSLFLAECAKDVAARAAREADARAHVQMAQDLVTRVVSATRGDALRTEAVEVGDVVATATREAASDAAVQLTVDVAAGLVVHGDAVLLARAIAALVDNARDVARGAGRERVAIRVEARAATGGVVVRVEDDGPGIDPAVRSLLFEPLASARPGGTGLGLRFVRAVAELHRGSVGVEDRPGEGAVFFVALAEPSASERQMTPNDYGPGTLGQ